MPNRSDVLSPTQPGPLVTAAVLLLSAMTVMANATISASLPGLRAHYSDVVGIETLAGLILTLPSLAVMLTAGLFGWLADKLDRQKLLIAAGLLYAVGGTAGLWVDSLQGMLIGRAILGVGVAGTMVLATVWATDLWQGTTRTRFLGWQGAAMSAGGIVVIMIGGALAFFDWRGAFGTYFIIIPVTMLALYALAPYARERSKASDITPKMTLAIEPFPWHIFALVGTLGFLFMTTFYMMPTRLPFLLGEVGVTNPLILSAIIALVTLAAVPGALAFSRIQKRMPAIAVFALSWGLMGTGTLVISAAPDLPMMAVGVVIVGIGLGPAFPSYTSYLMIAVPKVSRGRASGLMTTAFFAGQFASPIVVAPLVASFGLTGAFKTMSILQLALAAALALAAMKRTTKP